MTKRKTKEDADADVDALEPLVLLLADLLRNLLSVRELAALNIACLAVRFGLQRPAVHDESYGGAYANMAEEIRKYMDIMSAAPLGALAATGAASELVLGEHGIQHTVAFQEPDGDSEPRCIAIVRMVHHHGEAPVDPMKVH